MVIAKGQQMLADDILNLTFFPQGTVLMYSSAAWNGASAAFKNIWHICDGTTVNGYKTLKLVDKFIRGSTVSGTEGGTDTVPVPYHTHEVTETAHNHTQPEHSHSYARAGSSFKAAAGTNSSWNAWRDNGLGSYSTGGAVANISAAKTNLSVNYAGSTTADNKPEYCTVIFIESAGVVLSNEKIKRQEM